MLYLLTWLVCGDDYGDDDGGDGGCGGNGSDADDGGGDAVVVDAG